MNIATARKALEEMQRDLRRGAKAADVLPRAQQVAKHCPAVGALLYTLLLDNSGGDPALKRAAIQVLTGDAK